jgi:hypothetical protein
MSEIIEDTISRNKKFQEERTRRLKRMRELNAPDIIIQTEEMISKMTIAEYKIFCQQAEEEDKKVKAEYAKNNPIQKHIVDEIYNRESKLSYTFLTYSSTVQWTMAINPLSFMSADDYDNDLYQTFLDHARELYQERLKEKWEA